MAVPETPILRVLDAYAAAVLARDVEAFVALYDERASVFDAWDEWSYEGIDAWRAMAAGWFASLGAERVVVDAADVRVRAADDLAVLRAIVTYRAVAPDGAELRSVSNRLTWALERKREGWKIVHEHTSLPVGHETMRAVPRRG